MEITNFGRNGNCSNCGQCCCDTICVTKGEVRKIAQYVLTHKVTLFPLVRFPLTSVRVTCPFRNEVLKKCEIYPVRPEICKTFACWMGAEAARKNFKRLIGRPGATCNVSLNWIFLGDPTLFGLIRVLDKVDRADWLGFDPKLLEERK